MADYIRTMNADGIGGVKSWTVCLINVSGHGENFDIADLKNIGGGIYREEGSGVDSYAATCSIHAMTSAGHEYLDYDKQAYDKVLQLSGVIQIFMSSDGQSIPFGNNWIHKIEDGLNNAKIMFVFVTPTSIESGWIYFEAGFAYSKGIDVIPVGVGIDIGSIRPPLSLLQGFNITSSESLNNFVTVINKNLLIPDGKSMGTYRFCNENVRFTILDKNKYYNAEPAQYILSIGFRPEDTTSEQMLNCIRNLIDIGIIAKDDASS